MSATSQPKAVRQWASTFFEITSGKVHKPPQRPDEGRRSSRTVPLCSRRSQVARFVGRAFFGRAAGMSATRLVFLATQSLRTGQALQSGFAFVQPVAPRSIMAWV